MNLIFLGPPGAGKGTQAALISKELGITHLSSGDLFRQAVMEGGKIGQKIREYQAKGVLVPDELAIALVGSKLSSIEGGFILDGFPRTVEQARALDKYLEERGKKLDLVVYFDIPKEEVVRRISSRRLCRRCQAPYNLITSPPKEEGRCDICGGELFQREDDKEEVVLKRFEVYLKQTYPLLDYYQDKLVSIDAIQSIDKVTDSLRRVLGRKDE